MTPKKQGKISRAKVKAAIKRVAARAKLPKSVRIAGFDFEILPLDPDAVSDKYGRCDYEKLQIKLDLNVARQQIQHTLLHEIHHAIQHTYNIMSDNEEHLVDTLATAWLQIYRDNPKLMTYLTKCK